MSQEDITVVAVMLLYENKLIKTKDRYQSKSHTGMITCDGQCRGDTSEWGGV